MLKVLYNNYFLICFYLYDDAFKICLSNQTVTPVSAFYVQKSTGHVHLPPLWPGIRMCYQVRVGGKLFRKSRTIATIAF